MGYSDFTLKAVCREFSLTLVEVEDLHAGAPGAEAGRHLVETLAENVPLAVAVHTEKVRSELIVAPILVEVRRATGHRVSLFSGIEFEVAPERGLKGVC